MTLQTKQVQKKYNRYSFFYNFIEWPIEKVLFRQWRKSLLKEVRGNVLEIGVGTGKNIQYYNHKLVSLTAVDISRGMLQKAKEMASKYEYPVKFKLINKEVLPFKSNSFDYVILTFVLCSVSNQEKMWNEIKRVVKRDGKILLLEHVLSKHKLIAFLENIHNPITRLFGFNVNRDTVKTIKKVGLNIVREENLFIFDVFKKLELKK